MANVTLKGNPIHTVGELPKVGSPGPDFRLTRADLSDISFADFEGKVKILDIVSSLDTGVGAASARRFENEAGDLGNVVVPKGPVPCAPVRFSDASGDARNPHVFRYTLRLLVPSLGLAPSGLALRFAPGETVLCSGGKPGPGSSPPRESGDWRAEGAARPPFADDDFFTNF